MSVHVRQRAAAALRDASHASMSNIQASVFQKSVWDNVRAAELWGGGLRGAAETRGPR